MDGIEMKIREVTEKDYDDVLSIRDSSGIYGGRDYLPDYYRSLINTKGYTGYVVEVDGKLISFEFGVCLDEGRTLGARASRVSKDWEGKKIYKALAQHVVQEFTRKHGAKRKVLTFDNNNQQMVKRIENGQCKLLTSRKIYSYRSVIGDVVLNKGVTSDVHCVQEVKPDGLQKIFSSDNDINHLFPDEMVTVYWLPYRLLNFNIPLIFAGNCASVGSGIPCIGQTDDTGPLLTFGQHYNSSLCFMFQLDVYGTDYTKLSDHLSHHLKNIKHPDPSKDMELMIYVEKDCDVGIIDGILKDFGFSRIITNIVTQYSAEIDIV